MSKLRIASFDVGKRNFAHYVEVCDIEALHKLERKYLSLPKLQQRRVKGKVNEGIKAILTSLFKTGKRIHTGVYDITSNDCDAVDIDTRKNMIHHLTKYKHVWDKCDVFVIEQQYCANFTPTLGFGRRKAGGSNMDAIKLGECLCMWLLTMYPTKEVTFFGSQNKTQILGAPFKLTKPQRKKWAVEKAKEVYALRGDTGMAELYKLQELVKRKRVKTATRRQGFLDTCNVDSGHMRYLAKRLVKSKQKLDDVSDCLLQAQAYKFRVYVADF